MKGQIDGSHVGYIERQTMGAGPRSRVEGGFSTERSYNGKKGCRLAADREDKVEPQRWVGA